MDRVVRLEKVSKLHGSGAARLRALEHLDLDVRVGEFVSIMGPSGCGKTTILNLIAGLDEPTSGRVSVDGRDLAGLSERERSEIRAGFLGFVFQSFNLLPRISVEDNVAWRLDRIGVRGRKARARTAEVLTLVGVPATAWGRLPLELSGGEQQRVAIARALVTDPKLLLADEPTGNLDSATGDAILGLLRKLNREGRMAVVMVTHDGYAATYGHRTVVLRDGRVATQAGSMEARVVPLRPRSE
jgi:putative ABC transport system ATP-binding protein